MRAGLKPISFRLRPFLRSCLSILLTAAALFVTESVNAQERCSSIFGDIKIVRTQSDSEGAAFLYGRNSQLASHKWLERIAQKSRYGNKRLTQPLDKVESFLRYLSYLRDRTADTKTYIRMRDQFVRANSLKINEVPESYYTLQLDLAREAGKNISMISPAGKLRLGEIVVKDQQRSLEIWVDYLASPEMANQPMWMKYWILNGVISLGKYDPAAGVFSSRGKNQIAPFAELNKKALEVVITEIKGKVDKKNSELGDEVFEQLLGSGNFGKLYGRSLYLQIHNDASHFKITNGSWKLFKKGEDPQRLVDSLCGMGTGWCTMYPETAKEQLTKGDFHIYYSKNDEGLDIHPRIAIRMEGARIGEVRGVDKDQNMDPYIDKTDVLAKKLEEFGSEAELYIGRMQAMKKLKGLLEKTKSKQELQVDELEFLYETKTPIVGFGHERPPVLRDILKLRNPYRDYSRIYNVPEALISLNPIEAKGGGKTFHVGDLQYFFEAVSIEKLHVEGTVAVERFAQYPQKLSARGIVVMESMSVANTRLEAPVMSFMEFRRFENAVLRTNILDVQGTGRSLSSAKIELFEGTHFDLSFVHIKFDDVSWPQGMKSARLRGENAEKLNLPEGLKKVELSVKEISDLKLPRSLEVLHLSEGRVSLSVPVPEVILSNQAAVRFMDKFEGNIRFEGALEVVWPKELKGFIKIDSFRAERLLRSIPEHLRSRVQIIN